MVGDLQTNILAILSKVSLNQTCETLDDCTILAVYPPLLLEKLLDRSEPQAG